MHLWACSKEKLFAPPSLPSVCRDITAQQRQGRSMPCFCQLKQRDRALYSNLYCIYSVIYNTNRFSLQVCKWVFHFICFDPLAAHSFWQLLCHTEEQMIHSCSFNVIRLKVTLLLDVTLKMFGPWAIDHSQEKKNLITHGWCVWFLLADRQIEH